MRAAWLVTGLLWSMPGCAHPTAAASAPAPAPLPVAATPPAKPEPKPEPEPKPRSAPKPAREAEVEPLPAWACSCHPFLQQLLVQRRADEAAAGTGSTTRIGWAALDLQVAAADPFRGLAPVQRPDALAYVAWKLADRDRSPAEAAALQRGAAAAAERLAAGGVQAEAVWIRARQLQLMHRTARLQAMTAKWHGRRIRLTGYVIPLTFTAAGITEFLLLPERPPAGAPPRQGPTQLVTVTTEVPLAAATAQGAVVVEGRVTVGGELPVEIPVAGSDTPAIVRSGYLLDAASVTPADAK